MSEKNLAIVILAAGQGTRMRSRTPKVLHTIGGRSLVGHVITTAGELDAAHVEVVVRHEREAVVAFLGEHYPGVTVVDQDDVPGTGRAVELAVNALPSDWDGDVLVLSGDVPLLPSATMSALISEHHATGAKATVLSAVLADPTGYGRVIRDDSGAVVRIVEQKDATPEQAAVTEINAGVYVFSAAALRATLPTIGTDNAQGEKYLTDVIGLLRSAGDRVSAEITVEPQFTLGVNDRVQLSEVARLLNERIVQKWQRAGVTVMDPKTTWIDDEVTIEADATILPNTYLLGATTIATGAVVGPDTTLVDCEVGEDATVKRVDGNLAVIGARATVGPWSYLRPGTTLAEDGKIGTFVETKNSQIGARSKVPHLSYVGDTTIGEGVNLGAGAITANYDDLTKHRTVIGDEVHTGSHNVFVAPVTIGAGAKTGAGAVIRKDVPAGALALSVAPQRNVEGWVENNRQGTQAAKVAEDARNAQKAADGGQGQEEDR